MARTRAARQIRVAGHVPDGRGGTRVVFAAIEIPCASMNQETLNHFRVLARERFRQVYPQAGATLRYKMLNYTETETDSEEPNP